MINNFQVQTLVIFVSSFFVSFLIIKFFRKNSERFGLIDKPNHRKVHLTPTPVVGGISIFISFFLTALIDKSFVSLIIQYPQIFGSALVILVMAIWDDRNNLPAIYRLMLQLLTALAIAASGIRITSLNGIFGINELDIIWQYIITIIFLAFATNAFNLMDGVDGLLGSISFINLGVLGVLFYYLNMSIWLLPIVAFMGATLQFLRFNFSKNKIFMGDAGSMGLGFFINVLAIMALQKSITTPSTLPVYQIVAALLFIPFIDAVRVFITRIKKGNSPFTPDRNHLHHLWMMAGMGHKHITLYIVLSHICFIILTYFFAHHFSILIAIIILALIFFSIVKFLYFNRNMEEWMSEIKKMESESSIK